MAIVGVEDVDVTDDDVGSLDATVWDGVKIDVVIGIIVVVVEVIVPVVKVSVFEVVAFEGDVTDIVVDLGVEVIVVEEGALFLWSDTLISLCSIIFPFDLVYFRTFSCLNPKCHIKEFKFTKGREDWHNGQFKDERHSLSIASKSFFNWSKKCCLMECSLYWSILENSALNWQDSTKHLIFTGSFDVSSSAVLETLDVDAAAVDSIDLDTFLVCFILK